MAAMIRLPVQGFAREAIVSAVACAAYAEEHGDGDASSVRALATAFDGGSLVFGDGSEVETIARYVEDMAGEEYTLATQAQRCGDAEAARDGCLVGRRLRDLAAKVLRLGHALRA